PDTARPRRDAACLRASRPRTTGRVRRGRRGGGRHTALPSLTVCPHFELLGERDGVRRRRYHTAHGSFETPCFAPVGTYATVKGLTPEQLAATGAELVLANSYHPHVRPGPAAVRELGGLHRFMGWDRPILTDSGGYQVFSLDRRCRIDDDGVTFQCVIDGSPRRLTPESVLGIQRDLGPDIAMVLDHCPPGDAGA